jgi:hypothetical protein
VPRRRTSPASGARADQAWALAGRPVPAIDITLAELSIEALFPADEITSELVRL